METNNQNPYDAPANAAMEQPRTGSGSKLHWVFFTMILGLWIITLLLTFTPNNQLHRMGLGNAVALDFLLGIPFAFCIAITSLCMVKSAPSKWLFGITQLLAWGHSVGLIALLVFAAISRIRHGGV